MLRQATTLKRWSDLIVTIYKKGGFDIKYKSPSDSEVEAKSFRDRLKAFPYR